MPNLPQHILDHFLHHWPRLQADPDELAARLQRRHRAMLTHPPRAWCIALRASDTRIGASDTPLRAGDTRMTAHNTILDDCHALGRTHGDGKVRAHHRPHTVTIDAALVRRLCRPVHIQPPGEPWRDVAAALGVNAGSLRRHMQSGFFQVRRIRLGGKPGPTIPLLDHAGPLDPCSQGFRPPDPHWGDAWQWHHRLVPPDLCQAVRREPVIAPPPRNFRGWIWRCPACARRADILYFPLPILSPEVLLELRLHLHEADAPPRPVPAFACSRCHHVAHVSRAELSGWNDIVTYLTCGLLYGHEVPRPADWLQRTKKPFRKPNARPAVRRAEVERLLIETDLTRAQIAARQGISLTTLSTQIDQIHKRYGVHSREALRERARKTGYTTAPSQPAQCA